MNHLGAWEDTAGGARGLGLYDFRWETWKVKGSGEKSVSVKRHIY